MKYLLLFLIFCQLKSVGQSKTWSISEQSYAYTTFYKVSDTLFSREVDKVHFAECAVSKIEARFPNGFDGYSSDSLRNEGYKIGYSCAIEISKHLVMKWSSLREQDLISSIEKTKQLQLIREDLRKPLCNCMVKKLKTIFPGGLPYPFGQGILT